MVGEPDRDAFGFESHDDAWLDLLREAEADSPLGRLGPYELVEEISRGGQGIVYRARETEGRELAVKRMAAGSFATATTRRRFEREIEAAAALDHPNIVSVLGVHQVDGQSILAMEWIDGVPVTAWADRSRPVREVLQTFIKVCAAVHHAHQRGVIHRDLKPSNILVDAAGDPHVLDFGLAKRDAFEPNRSAVTLSGQFLGTPAYSSPEHVRGGADAVDVRSDVYSLGVVLYEMLVGRMPYPVTGSLAEVFQSIEQKPPERPRASGVSLDREVEAILGKALAKDPGHRYQSVDALGRDLDRHLRGEAVEAKSHSSLYVLVKTLRRYKVPAALAASFLMLVVAFGVTMLVMYQRAERSAQRATQVQGFLHDMLTSASPYRNEGELNVLLMLQQASDRIETELVDHPEAEAGVRFTIGQVYSGLWRWEQAEPHLRRALELYRDEHGEVHDEFASCVTLLGRALTHQGRSEGILLQQDALRIRQELYGETHPLVAEAWANLGFAVWKTSLPTERRSAERYYGRAMEIYAGHPQASNHRARSTYSYAAFNVSMQRLGRADELFSQSVAMYRAMAGSGDVYMNRCLEDYAWCLRKLRRYDEAAAILAESIDRRPKGLALDHVARLHWDAGELHRRRGEHEQALGQFDRSLAKTCELLAREHPEEGNELSAYASLLLMPDHESSLYRDVFVAIQRVDESRAPALVVPMLDMAHSLWQTGDAEAGEGVVRECLVMIRPMLPANHLAVADCRSLLGACLTELGRFGEAETELTHAFAVLRETRGPTCPYTISTIEQLIHLYGRWGRDDRADEYRDLLARALGS